MIIEYFSINKPTGFDVSVERPYKNYTHRPDPLSKDKDILLCGLTNDDYGGLAVRCQIRLNNSAKRSGIICMFSNRQHDNIKYARLF